MEINKEKLLEEEIAADLAAISSNSKIEDVLFRFIGVAIIGYGIIVINLLSNL